MKKDAILLENVSSEKFMELIVFLFLKELEPIIKQLNSQSEKDDLMTRDQVLDLLQINASTLWHWQNKGRIKVYKFANKCYYKRSEILASLTLLKK